MITNHFIICVKNNYSFINTRVCKRAWYRELSIHKKEFVVKQLCLQTGIYSVSCYYEGNPPECAYKGMILLIV